MNPVKRNLSGCILAFSLLFVPGCDDPASGNNPPAVDYSMAEGEYFRILSPNGGEQITYGDMLTISWLMKLPEANEAVVQLIEESGNICDYNGSSSMEWFVWPKDEGSQGMKEMKMVDEANQIVMATYKLMVRDTSLDDAGCDVTFSGAMQVRVYHPYGDERNCEECFEGDMTDSAFIIIGR